MSPTDLPTEVTALGRFSFAANEIRLAFESLRQPFKKN